MMTRRDVFSTDFLQDVIGFAEKNVIPCLGYKIMMKRDNKTNVVHHAIVEDGI